jgi:hypothetical protein
MWFSFIHTTLWTLSCPPVTCFCYTRKMWHLFSSLNMVQCHGGISDHQQTCSQSTVFTLFSKNSYGCNICIPFLWFESKNLQCFFTSFLIGGMKKQDWNLNYASPAWQHIVCLHQALGKPRKGSFTLVVSLLHDEHSSPSSCILPSAPLPKIEK